MSRRKTAACKFIEAKTMVIPKPGKFPDVENKPIKSDTSGTDNIEDQKYHDKDAADWQNPPGTPLSGVERGGVDIPDYPPNPVNQHFTSRDAGKAFLRRGDAGRLGQHTDPGRLGQGPFPRANARTNNLSPGHGVHGTPEAGDSLYNVPQRRAPYTGGAFLPGAPEAWTSEEGRVRPEDKGLNREQILTKQNSANNLMHQAIKQAIWPFGKKKEKEEKPAGPQVGDIYTGGVLLESEEDVDAHLQPMMQADTLKFQQENPGASFEDFMASPVGQDWIKPRDELSAEDQLIARGEKQAHGDGSFGGFGGGGGGDPTMPEKPPWGGRPGPTQPWNRDPGFSPKPGPTQPWNRDPGFTPPKGPTQPWDRDPGFTLPKMPGGDGTLPGKPNWYDAPGIKDELKNRFREMDAPTQYASPAAGSKMVQASARNPLDVVKQATLNKNAIEDYGADKSLVLAQQPYLHPGVSRRDVSPDEEETIAKNKKRWFPRIFESKGMPLTDRLSSPGKGALMSGLGGGVVGALGGALAGSNIGNIDSLSDGARGTGALIGAGVGGLGLGGLSALMSYYGRKARNEGVLEDVRRFPEGSTLRDLQSDPVYQGQMQREADARASRMNTGGNAGLLAAILASR